MKYSQGFGAIWRLMLLDFPAKSKSGVPNSSIALAFIIISERCYS